MILHHFEHVRHRRFHGGGNIAHNRPGDAQQVLNSTLGAYAHLGFGECAHLVYAKLLIFACRQILQPLKRIAAELVPLRREHWAQGLLIGLAIHPQPLAHLPRIQLLSRRRVDLGLVIDHAGVHLGLDLHIDGAFGELARAFEVEHIPNQREAHRVRHPVIGKKARREHPVPVPRRPIDHRLVYARSRDHQPHVGIEAAIVDPRRPHLALPVDDFIGRHIRAHRRHNVAPARARISHRNRQSRLVDCQVPNQRVPDFA